jgi:uncharacterized protein (TIGR03435 family)
VLTAAGTHGPQNDGVQQAFELVSLRRVPPACSPGFSPDFRCLSVRSPEPTWRLLPGARLEATAQPTINFIRMAYGLEGVDHRWVSGGPEWITRERYDLTALAISDALDDESSNAEADRAVRAMLRTLLADRFKLRARRAAVKIGVIVLRRRENTPLGPNLRQASAACALPAEFKAADLHGSIPCAQIQGESLEARGVSMADFARILTALPMFYWTIVDETGMAGHFDVAALPITPKHRRGPMTLDSVLDLRPLGLELKRATRSVDGLVIDHIEKPAED